MIKVPDQSVETEDAFTTYFDPISYTPRLLIARRGLGPKVRRTLLFDFSLLCIPSAALKAWDTVNAYFGTLPELRCLSF